MSLEVKQLQPDKFENWDKYVTQHERGTFFHRAGWKTVLEKALRHKAHYLYVEQDGKVVGVLPLGHMKSLLFGNSLSSTPFCVYGGILSDNPDAEAELLTHACKLAESLGVDALELKNRYQANPDWPVKELYVTFRKEISSDAEENLKAIPRKQRAMVRKGIKAELESEEDSGIQRLYRIYSESVRNLGTPVFPAKLFRTLREVFAEDCRVLMITHKGKDVAGVMSFYFRDEVLPYYGGSIADARTLKANDFMYWELMRRSAEEGVRIFDYGRSKVGTGSYSFKKNWGFTPEPLYYNYHLVKSKEIPEINPNNPKYQLFIKAWKKLPLSVANAVGPMLSRNLG